MPNVNVLRIRFDNLLLYKNGALEINFCAKDRVSKKEQVFEIMKGVYTQKVLSFVGINASGKTSSLKLINFALTIIIDNENLNVDTPDVIKDGTSVTANFIYNDELVEWNAVIGKKGSDKTDDKKYIRFYYKEETLKVKPIKRIKTKKDMFVFDKKCQKVKRSELKNNDLKYMKDGDSILLGTTRENDSIVSQLISYTNVNLFLASGKQPSEIIDAFDPSIESFSCDGKEDIHYKVTFKNKELAERIADPIELNNIVSSGTIKGQNIMKNVIYVLHNGGYLIVDELENHLNKEIVKMIIDIFKNKKTNPLGACLIFSTHYIELLDFIDRKDNIYIARKKDDFFIDILNYAEQCKRADVKKSDVIFSNLIKGTAPQYENITQLKEYLCHI